MQSPGNGRARHRVKYATMFFQRCSCQLSNSPTNVQQDAFKPDPVYSLQTKGSAYGLRYPIIFSDFSYCCYWKQISGELCQCTEEEHKNFCFSLAGALGGLMALVMVLVITWVVGGLLTGSVVLQRLPPELENKWRGIQYFSALWGEKQEGGCGKSLQHTGSFA